MAPREDPLTCCLVGCEKWAEWVVSREGSVVVDQAYACTEHVGQLLGQSGLHHVWPVPHRKEDFGD